jgi:hypothetical protein
MSFFVPLLEFNLRECPLVTRLLGEPHAFTSKLDRLFPLGSLPANFTATNRRPSFASTLSKRRFLSWRCKVLNAKP